ncbi:hypothetical protein GCM10027299_42280 [Larkinella ripae]
MLTLSDCFDVAKSQLLNEKWNVLLKAQNWWEILPCPDLNHVYLYRSPISFLPNLMINGKLISQSETQTEHRLKWQIWAKDFFDSKKEKIRKNLSEMEDHLNKEVETWNNIHFNKPRWKLTSIKLLNDWVSSVEHLTVEEFTKLNIWPSTAANFRKAITEELERVYKIPNDQSEFFGTETNSIIPIDNSETFKLRRFVILHSFQNGKEITRGDVANQMAIKLGLTSGDYLFNKYKAFGNTKKRLEYVEKETQLRAQNLIYDMEAILPKLNPIQRQQAESEINTLKSKIV